MERAVQLGMDALALTDHDALYGAPVFARATREAGIKPIYGAELTLHDDSHLTLLVENATGWANLCRLITLARHNAAKGTAHLPENSLNASSVKGLIALSGCRRGAIASALLHGDHQGAIRAAQTLSDYFGRDHFYVELQSHFLPDDRWLQRELIALATQHKLDCVATNNVHYALPDQHRLQDVLVAIRARKPLDHITDLRVNAEYHLKTGAELAPLFADCSDALERTRLIAERCQFTLRDGLQSLPLIETPHGHTTTSYLRELCMTALAARDLPSNAEAQLDHELAIIDASGLSNYFLVVWDIVRFSRENGIRCQGRGSAANSLVAYLLNISPVNPLAHDLVFERFLSAERQVVPDIDIDFDAARREEVIQYIYQRYTPEHAAMACTFITFRARSAVRDIGKALGLPPDVLDRVTTTLESYDPQKLREAGMNDTLQHSLPLSIWEQILMLSEAIDGFPRHLGIHNGGMVITGTPLSHRLPTEPATMEDRVVVQWDKDGLEDVGMAKIDILGLRMLSAVSDAAHLIGADLDALTFDDPAVYDMICAADTVGVFQVESRAQQNVLPRLKPRTFNDLVISISLIRPGPIQGDMVHPYLRRRLGEEPVVHLHPLLEPALGETLGIILFQEQVLKVARDLAGFTPGQGELLRRALGSKHADAAIERFREQFVAGAVTRNVDEATAQFIFDKLRAFGSYSFPKSHAVAFAVIVYQSAWLKCHYPRELLIGLLNNQPMGFWTPAVLVSDAQRHNITLLGVDILRSDWRCIPERDAIRLGFNYVDGIGESGAARILEARTQKPFADLADFHRRTRLPRRLSEHLIQAGAFDQWGDRRALIWELGMLPDQLPALDLRFEDEVVRLPSLSAAEQSAQTFDMTRVILGDHPLAAQRSRLRARGLLSSSDLLGIADATPVRVAGVLIVLQAPPTAKGFRFLTLEDEDGFINVIVRPKLYARCRKVIRNAPLLIVTGIAQRQAGVVNVRAESFGEG